LFTSFGVLGFCSDNPVVLEDDGLLIFGKVGVVELISFLSSFFEVIISSIISSLRVILGVKT